MQNPPFPVECQLEDSLDALSQSASEVATARQLRLPSQPQIHMADNTKIYAHLAQEFLLEDLELLSPFLWMMAKQDYKSVSPLHRQIVKQRAIIVTEDPRLHLVWYYDRIFIKPIPRYLLSHRFWRTFLCSCSNSSEDEAIQRAILGYLRTYALLVKYEADFRIATRQDLQLIPENVSFDSFCDFICHFGAIPDRDTAGRYAFGELRLSRLNFYSFFLLGRMSFHRIHPQYGDYFRTFYSPFLFTFAVFSVILNTMQVALAAEVRLSWYTGLCRRMSMGVLAVVVGMTLWMALLFLIKFTKEWVYALHDRMSAEMVRERGKV